MWVPLSAKAIENIGCQNQERQPAGVPNVLGTRSAAAPTWDVSGGRPAGATQPEAGHKLPSVGTEWSANAAADAPHGGSVCVRPAGGWQPNHPVGVESGWAEQPITNRWIAG